MQFENDPFNSETTETGNILSDKIAEAPQKKWQTLMESTYFTHGSRKAEIVEGLRASSTAMQGTADQVAHHLLLNSKGNLTHRPSKVKITDNNNNNIYLKSNITEHSLTSPFTMEEQMKGIKILTNNKAAGLDDMLCERINIWDPEQWYG